MWQALALKALFMLLGVLGEFLKAAIEKAGEKKLLDRLAARAKWHAEALADSDLDNEAKRKALIRYVQDDAKGLGATIKDNLAGVVAELAVAAFKKEVADRLG